MTSVDVIWAGDVTPPWGTWPGQLLPERGERNILAKLVRDLEQEDERDASQVALDRIARRRAGLPPRHERVSVRAELRKRLTAWAAAHPVPDGWCRCGCGHQVVLSGNGQRQYLAGHNVKELTNAQLRVACRQRGLSTTVRKG